MHATRGLRAGRAWYTCMCGVCAWHACLDRVRGVNAIRAWLECVRAYVWGESEWRAGMRVCSIIFFNFDPALTSKSACTARSLSLSLSFTQIRTQTHTHTHTHTRARAHTNQEIAEKHDWHSTKSIN